MRNQKLIKVLALLVFIAGCGFQSTGPGQDTSFWVENGIEHEGVKINLGYHQNESAQQLVPAVEITRDGSPVSDALVFVSTSSGDKQNTLGNESATRYEQTGNSGVYLAAELAQSTGNPPAAFHFRILLDGKKPFEQKVLIPIQQ